MNTLKELANLDITTLDFSEHGRIINRIIDEYNKQSDDVGQDLKEDTIFKLAAKDIAWLVHIVSASLDFAETQQAIAAMQKLFLETPEEEDDEDDEDSEFDFSAPVTSEAQFIEGLTALFGEDAFSFR